MAQRPLYVKTIEGWKEINGEMYVKTASNWKPGDVYGRRESGWKRAANVQNWIWHIGTTMDPYHWEYAEGSDEIRNYGACSSTGWVIDAGFVQNDPEICMYFIQNCDICGGSSVKTYDSHIFASDTTPHYEEYGTYQGISYLHYVQDGCLYNCQTYPFSERLESHSSNGEARQLNYDLDYNIANTFHEIYCPSCKINAYQLHRAVYSEDPADHANKAQWWYQMTDGTRYYGVHRWPCEDCGGYDTTGYEADCDTKGLNGSCSVCGCYSDGTPVGDGPSTCNHEWGEPYPNDTIDTHSVMCTKCYAIENYPHIYDRYEKNDETSHTVYCNCGMWKSEPHSDAGGSYGLATSPEGYQMHYLMCACDPLPSYFKCQDFNNDGFCDTCGALIS